MKIAITSSIPGLALAMAARLEEAGFDHVVAESRDDGFGLHYGHGVPVSEVARINAVLAPFAPPVRPDGEPRDAVAIHLSPEQDLADCDLQIVAEGQDLVFALCTAFSGLGYKIDQAQCALAPKNELVYGGAPDFVRQLLIWTLAQKGIAVVERRAWPDFDDDVRLTVRDPAKEGLPAAQRFGVRIRCDDPEQAQGFADTLRAAGFAHAELDFGALSEERIRLDAGPFAAVLHRTENAKLIALIADLTASLGIDGTRYPLAVNEEDDADDPVATDATITLPLRACRERSARPWGGSYPERFSITVRSDRPQRARPLLDGLRAAGFSDVRVARDDGSEDGEPAGGFLIQWENAAGEAVIAEQIRGLVSTCMTELGVPPELALSEDIDGGRGDDVLVVLPIAGLEDGSLLASLSAARGFKVKLFTDDSEAWQPLIRELEGWGFEEVAVESASAPLRRFHGEDCLTRYGGAPKPLLDRIDQLVQRLFDLRLKPEKSWGRGDHDIWITLPAATPTARSEVAFRRGPGEIATDAGVLAATAPPVEETGLAFLELGADTLRVGSRVLARRTGASGPLVSLDAFRHFCLDGRTAATLEHLATSVLLCEPCLLEGETSTSKTSSVLFLAALLGQPVVRINLNGQTDTGELVGRFVPDHLAAEQSGETDARETESGMLKAATQRILQRAEEESRALTPAEVQQIAAHEGTRTQAWRWQDGLVPLAMRLGWWVLLDELNLAEPQVLERLNSVLESTPTLVLTEYDNRMLGGSGAEVHPDFRLFATMNPAEYAGRSVLSPAYRDRWRGYRFVDRPGEQEYAQMLEFLVSGQQPTIELGGKRYRGEAQAPAFPSLAELPDIGDFLAALARFHVSLEHAVGDGEHGTAVLGARRKERYVVTRRSLLGLLEYLASPLHPDAQSDPGPAFRDGLNRYYVDRMKSAEDKGLVAQLLDAAGIGAGCWKPGAVSNPPFIRLEHLPEEAKIATIRLLRNALGKGLRVAVELTKSLPQEIGGQLDAAARARLHQELVALGATAQLVVADGEH